MDNNSVPQKSIINPETQAVQAPLKKSFPKKIILIIVAFAGIFLTFLILIGLFILFGGTIFNPASKNAVVSPALIPATVIWNLQNEQLPKSEELLIKNAIFSKLSSLSFTTKDTDLLMTSASIAGNFGVLSGEERPRTPNSNPIATYTFLLVKSHLKWEATSTQDPGFCPVLKIFPDNILEKKSKDYWVGCKL